MPLKYRLSLRSRRIDWNPPAPGVVLIALLGTVGQAGAGQISGGTDGWFIGSGFWIPTKTGTAVDEPLPRGLSNQLEQNVPNPFNPRRALISSTAEHAEES